MPAYIDRMRNVRPQNGVLYGNIAWTSPPVPAVVIERNTIIARTEKNIIDKDLAAAHHVNTVTPAQVTDNYLRRAAAEHRVVFRIHHRNSIDQYIFGIGYFNAADRVV